MKYSIEDINVGDEVYFDSTKIQSNYDLYWVVKEKIGDKLIIELKEMGKDEKWTINVSEVRQMISTKRDK